MKNHIFCESKRGDGKLRSEEKSSRSRTKVQDLAEKIFCLWKWVNKKIDLCS